MAMKKIIVLLHFLLAFSSCNETNTIIGLKTGDKRITITDHYIYVERCTNIGGFNNSFWEYEKIICKDSINQSVLFDDLNKYNYGK